MYNRLNEQTNVPTKICNVVGGRILTKHTDKTVNMKGNFFISKR